MAGCWNLLSQQFLFRNVKEKIVVGVVVSGDADVDCTSSGDPKIYFAAANSVELVSPVACRLWVRPSLWRNSWWEAGVSTPELTPDFSPHAVLHIIHQLTTSWHQPLKMSPDLPYPQPVSLVYSACHKYRA